MTIPEQNLEAISTNTTALPQICRGLREFHSSPKVTTMSEKRKGCFQVMGPIRWKGDAREREGGPQLSDRLSGDV